MNKKFKKLLALGLCAATMSGNFAVYAEEAADEYASAYQLYVSVDGDDANPGTKDLPLASFMGAANKVKELKSGSRFKKRDIAVNFMPGEYKITNHKLGADYSGTERGKIIYRAVEPGTVDFRQTVDLPVSMFEKVTDEETLARLAPEAKDKVVKIDMTSILPADSYIGYNTETTRPYGGGGVPKLLHNNNLQTVARYPNVGYADMYLQDGTFSIIDGLQSNQDYKEHVVVKYDDEHIDNWRVDKNVTLRGWANWIGVGYVLKEVDAENNLLTFGSGQKPMLTSRETSPYNRIFFENILEELDVAGEYWVDENNKTLYYWPPEELGENDRLEFITGKERDTNIFFTDCSYITLKDLKFTGGCYNLLRMTNCHDMLVDGCEFSYATTYNIMAMQSTNIVVQNSTFYSGGGISIDAGDDMNYDLVSNLVDSGDVIDNNHFWDINRYSMYTNNVTAGGVSCKITNNTFHSTMGAGGTASGADSLVAYNEGYYLLLDTEDTCAQHTGRRWDMYGATSEFNFYHDIGNPDLKRGQTTWPCGGIYWDDSFSGSANNNNLLVLDAQDEGAHGIFMNGGRDHGGTGNVIVGATNAICNTDGYSWYAAYEDHPAGAGVAAIPQGLAQNFEQLYNLSKSGNTAYYQKYGKQMDVLYYDLMTQRQTSAKNLVFEKNVMFDVDNISKLRGTLPEGSYRNGINNSDTVSVLDNYYTGEVETVYASWLDQTYNVLHQTEGITRQDVFVDPDNLDYRVSENGKKLLGIDDDDFVLDESFDLNSIGCQNEIKTGEAFDPIYPINGEVTADRKTTTTLKWNKAKFADEYIVKIYKKADDTLVFEDTTVDNGIMVERLDPNTEYYWTVTACFKSFKNPTQWEGNCEKAYFTTGNFEKITEDILADSIIMRWDEKRMFVNGEEQEIPHGLDNPDNMAYAMVPFKEVAEALGMSWSYDEQERVFNVSYKGKSVSVAHGGETYGADGTLEYNVARNPYFEGDCAMVDINFFKGAFDINWFWHEDSDTLIFSKTVDSIRKVEASDVLALYGE